MGRISSNEEPQKQTTATHFSHPHPLQLITLHPNQTLTLPISCSGCNLKPSGTIYSCTTCNYFLHEKCFEMPKKISHPFHKDHSFTLLPTPDYQEQVFHCDACGETGCGFSYHCKPCSVDLHILCASMPFTLKNGCHNHKLDLTFESPYGTEDFSCDICKKPGSRHHWLYRCGLCGFDAHLNCARGPPPPMPAPAAAISRSVTLAPAQQYQDLTPQMGPTIHPNLNMSHNVPPPPAQQYQGLRPQMGPNIHLNLNMSHNVPPPPVQQYQGFRPQMDPTIHPNLNMSRDVPPPPAQQYQGLRPQMGPTIHPNLNTSHNNVVVPPPDPAQQYQGLRPQMGPTIHPNLNMSYNVPPPPAAQQYHQGLRPQIGPTMHPNLNMSHHNVAAAGVPVGGNIVNRFDHVNRHISNKTPLIQPIQQMFQKGNAMAQAMIAGGVGAGGGFGGSAELMRLMSGLNNSTGVVGGGMGMIQSLMGGNGSLDSLGDGGLDFLGDGGVDFLVEALGGLM